MRTIWMRQMDLYTEKRRVRERGQMRSKKELAALHTSTTAMAAYCCSRMSLCGLCLQV